MEHRWTELDVFCAVPAYRMPTFAVQEGYSTMLNARYSGFIVAQSYHQQFDATT